MQPKIFVLPRQQDKVGLYWLRGFLRRADSRAKTHGAFVHQSFDLRGGEGVVVDADIVQLAGDALGAAAIFAHVQNGTGGGDIVGFSGGTHK